MALGCLVSFSMMSLTRAGGFRFHLGISARAFRVTGFILLNMPGIISIVGDLGDAVWPRPFQH